jgi:hypothetical protein
MKSTVRDLHLTVLHKNGEESYPHNLRHSFYELTEKKGGEFVV